MRTYTATTTSTARPEAVLEVLTDPTAVARWAPVEFSVDDLTDRRLARGSRARVSGRLAGQEIGFDVEVHRADAAGLALSANGPVALDVAYELREADAGSEVSASIAVLPRRGLRARLLAEATAAVLAGGALQAALGRIVAEAVAAGDGPRVTARPRRLARVVPEVAAA
jgi:Polyketide cyclase / dehydrase and lipid transport